MEPTTVSLTEVKGEKVIASAFCKSPETMVGVVTAINDSPKIKLENSVFQFKIPYNITKEPVQCVPVSAATDVAVTDVDGVFKGAAVVHAPDSEYGVWMYRCNESHQFKNLTVRNEINKNGKLSGNISCVLLSPTCW